MTRPIITTLCGSTRFRRQFEQANRDLTLAGEIVISVGLFGHEEALDMGGKAKEMLDELHLRKIDVSDGIYVINVDGYVGESTSREIAYARAKGKTVRSIIPLADAREMPPFDPMAECGRLLARNEKLEAEVARLEAQVSRMRDPHEGDF